MCVCRRLRTTAGHCECVDVVVALMPFAVIHSPCTARDSCARWRQTSSGLFSFSTDFE